jgi:hypothetical protein
MSWLRRNKITPGAHTVPGGPVVFDGTRADHGWLPPAVTELKAHRDTPEYVNWIITVIAVIMTIGLTAVAFWLSYEHLHDVADANGLSGMRAWAWPATLDAFIVIGETLILRASIMRTVDRWAIFLTIIGSVGSIVLNVVGVGTEGDALDYTVAAVPPVAALLAFGILMRQLHQALTRRIYGTPLPEITPDAPGADGHADMVEAHEIMNRMSEDYVDDEPGPDAMTYRPEDERDTGMDAGLDALRGDTPGVPWRDMLSSVPDNVNDTPEIRDRVSQLPDTTMTIEGQFAPRLSLVPDAGDTEDIDQGQTPVSRPVPSPGDTDTGDTGTGRQGARSVPSRGRPGTGVTSRVRDIVRDNPGITNDGIRDKFAGEDIRPNTLNKSIKRVRDEM